jgi:hypothetical protein
MSRSGQKQPVSEQQLLVRRRRLLEPQFLFESEREISGASCGHHNAVSDRLTYLCCGGTTFLRDREGAS